MHYSRFHKLALTSLTFARLAKASGPTSIFINQVPEYSSLSSCAANEVSTIVRNMKDGCGDGSRTTSFDCFCSTSSSHFASLIDTRVLDACSGESEAGQNGNAVDVFGKYCELSTLTMKSSSSDSPSTTTSPSVTSSTPVPSSPTASPAAGLSTASITSAQAESTFTNASSSTNALASSTGTSPQPTEKPQNGTSVITIAVSVVAPIVAISLGILAFLLYRRRNPPPAQEKASLSELSTEGQINEINAHKEGRQFDHIYASRTAPAPAPAPVEIAGFERAEMGGGETRAELASPTEKSGVSLEAYQEFQGFPRNRDGVAHL
ncbi:unnamed protein product [Periconia digitata]|uniref:Extracellular membrane protein CFEM domain-containing protein n=1 Tax=Periconia digitata TaxID=1303443 RepID=A0A9W4UKI6_9PLEO|nr:unnamed protein product [Periconia digitata]